MKRLAPEAMWRPGHGPIDLESAKAAMIDASFSAGKSKRLLNDLTGAVVRYLASDGSTGLYDAEKCNNAREELLKIVSAEKIHSEQNAIRNA